MNRIKRLSCFLFLVIFSGCGSAQSTSQSDVMLRSSTAQRPSWVNSAGTVKSGGNTMFVGRASGIRNETDAISIATNDAFSKMSSHFGVSVKSDFISSEQETNGEYSYNIGLESRITGSAIKVKNYNIQGTYTEQWKRSSKEFDAFVLLAVPNQEIARIRIEVEGAGVWSVISNHDEAVVKTKDLLNVIAKKRKIKFKQQPIPLNPDYDVNEVLSKAESAFLLVVKCDVGKTEEYSGEFYTEVKTVVELVSLLEGKIIDRWNLETKGGAFSKQDSINNGIQQSFSNIADKL